MRQQIGERNDHDGLAEEAEKDGLLLFAERFEYGLAHGLQRLKNKGQEIEVKGRGRLGQQHFIGAENGDPERRIPFDQQPHNERVKNGDPRHQKDGLSDMLRLPGAVVVADDGRGPFDDGRDGRIHDLAHRGDDGHDRNIDLAAKTHQHGVAGNLHKAVGALHDK